MLVVRPNDIAFAVHPEVRAKDAIEMVELVLPETQIGLERRREEAKEKARQKAQKGTAQ